MLVPNLYQHSTDLLVAVLCYVLLPTRMVDRLRLLMLYFITQAVPQEMRNQLFQLSRCQYEDREIANNLEFLGVKLDVAAPPPAKKWWVTDLLRRKSVAEDEIEYDLPRYLPAVKSIVEVQYLVFLVLSAINTLGRLIRHSILPISFAVFY